MTFWVWAALASDRPRRALALTKPIPPIRRAIINGTAPQRLQLNTTQPIQSIELTDLTDGTGAFALRWDGLGQQSLDLLLASRLFRGHVAVRVRVFAELTTPNHHEVGQLHNSSRHLLSQVLGAGNLTHGFLDVRVPNNTIDFVRFTDLTNGTGGRVQMANLFDNRLQAVFEVRPQLAFLLDVYGRPLNETTSTDIVVGEEHPDQFLVETRAVNEWGERTTIVVPSVLPISRIVVRNVSGAGNAAAATLLVGDVGGHVVVVQVEAKPAQWLRFTVDVWARRTSRRTLV